MRPAPRSLLGFLAATILLTSPSGCHKKTETSAKAEPEAQPAPKHPSAEPGPPAETGPSTETGPPAESGVEPMPDIELPDDPDEKIRAAAGHYLNCAWDHVDASGLPTQFFREGQATTIVTEEAHDDEPSLRRTKLTGHAAVQEWLFENVYDPPGLMAGFKINSCNDAGCCTFSNAGNIGDDEDGNIPHEVVELRAVCFDVGEDGSLHTKRMKIVFW